MSLTSDISAYLVANSIGTAGTASKGGWSIYQGKIPNAPDQMIALFEYAGRPPGLHFDGAGVRNPSLQVRVRAAQDGYATGLAKAESILTLLHGVANTTLSGTVYQSIQALGSVNYLSTNDAGKPEWSINFMVVREA